MTSGPVQRSIKDIAPGHPEVEFALVLARTIDSVSADPQQLRSAVYELARQKLRELAHEDPSEKERLLQALEVAIEGVEAHTRNNPVIEKFPVPPAGALPSFAEAAGAPQRLDEPPPARVERSFGATFDNPDQKILPRRGARWSSPPPLRYVAMLLFLGMIAAVVLMHQRGISLALLRTTVARELSQPLAETPKPVEMAHSPPPVAAPPAPEPKKSLLPTAYGVYAESGGKLFELQTLQMRAPDPRVAISAAITKPSETLLPDGHVRFVVFRREDNAASDPIDVRMVARVTQVTTFDAAGKPVVSPGDQSWVIRNISIPFHAAPSKEDPQMFEVQPRDPDTALAPGRYVLVLKAQAYDFTIEGTVTDKRQCLQRLAAANGVFYSECAKP